MASMLNNIQKISLGSIRRFSRNVVLKDKVATATAETSKSTLSSGKMHSPNNMEKHFLVWAKKYKTLAEVPSMVKPEVMDHARNKARIRISNYMMLATAFACFVMIISGKNAQSRGESVQKANLEWHQRYNLANKEEQPKEN